MRRLPLALALAALGLGCASARFPPPPEGASVVILTSDVRPDRLFAHATAAFLGAGWDVVETRDFRFLVRPAGMDTLLEVSVADALPEEGEARLVAIVDAAFEDAPTLVRRTARLLSALDGTLSYR